MGIYPKHATSGGCFDGQPEADAMPDCRLLLRIKDAPLDEPLLSKYACDGTMKMFEGLKKAAAAAGLRSKSNASRGLGLMS